MKLYASRTTAEAAAERLRSFAQPQRLMILSRLLDGEHTVGAIEEATGIGQPALSQQLAELRRAEIVTTRRVSKQVYYRLADERMVLWVRSIEAIVSGAELADSVSIRPTGTMPLRSNARPISAASFVRIG